MKGKSRKAHGSKTNTKKITKNKLQAAAEHKKATGVKQPKRGVKITALKKKKPDQRQAEAGGLVAKKPSKLNAAGTSKDNLKRKKKVTNPYIVKGNKKSKNDTESGETEVLSSSSSPTYVQQSQNSLNKTRLSKPSAHVLQEPETSENNQDQDPANFPDQSQLNSNASAEDERGMKEES